ncbi:hypothetical protein ABPG72_003602 [Tetrahymena utriculariae]
MGKDFKSGGGNAGGKPFNRGPGGPGGKPFNKGPGGPGGKFGGKGGPGGKFGGPKGGRGAKTIIVKHRLEGVFICKGQQEALVTKNFFPGESVYNEKRMSVEENGEKIEYRVWNPYRSKIAAAVVGGISDIYIRPGSKVLYLGGASGTTVSHVADIVGPTGVVYAVEFSHRSGRDLVNMAKKRNNVVPIIGDARKPQEYRFLVGMVDIVFADVAQPDQARIMGMNCQYFLKNGGHFLISIKACCIDSTNEPAVVFSNEVQKLKEEGLKPEQQLTLEPYERDHAMVLGSYRA